MKLTRSVGFYLLACSLLCAIIALESYQSRVGTAKEVARRLGIRLESVDVPLQTKVAGFLSITMGVAGAVCLFDFYRNRQSVDPSSESLLQ
jgi:hypothetical protein